ncbi:hypothetical protein V1509DRAFT_625923 [Lipomyces kononenkoae]
MSVGSSPFFDAFTSSPRCTTANGLYEVQASITDRSEDILESDGPHTTGTSVHDYTTIVTSPPMHVLSTDPIDDVHMHLPRTPEAPDEPVQVICEITLSPINPNCIRRPPGTSRSRIRKKNTVKDGAGASAVAAKSHKRHKICNDRQHETRQHPGNRASATDCRNSREKSNHMSADPVDNAQINENKLTDVMLSSENEFHIIDFPSSPPPKTLLPQPRHGS